MNDTIRNSIVGLAEKSPYVSYADLHTVLGTKSDFELEGLLVEAIYEGTIEGKLDPAKQLLEIMDWKATIPSAEQCAFIGKVLTEWAGHCEALIGDLNTTAESALQQTEQES